MKAHYKYPILFLLCALILQSCCREKHTTYMGSSPMYMSYEELRKSVHTEGPADLKKPGKIYQKGRYIYINELYKGIHIVDNSNPAAPQRIAFINIPGNVDIAVKGNYLYADNAVDLVVIDISNPMQAKEINRVKDIFPYMIPGNMPTHTAPVDRTKGVVVAWKDTLITESRPCY